MFIAGNRRRVQAEKTRFLLLRSVVAPLRSP